MASRTVEVKILADVSKLQHGFKSAEASSSKFGRSMGRLGGGMKRFGVAAAGVGLIAGAGLAKGIADSITAASDLNETVSKTGVIFGKSAPAVLKFADGAATSLGQSKRSALEAATTFATFGKAAGLGGKDLVSFSTGLTSLSSDLASFSNTSPEEAIDAIGAALRGETEPIRKYGVMLDDASMRQEALRMGLIKTTKDALTPQQKALVAQSLIYKQTKAAQGDFARTSTGLANQQRILAAQFENTKAQVGAAFLPLLTKVLPLVNAAMPKIAAVITTYSQQAVAWVEQNWPRIRDKVQEVMAALRPIIEPLLKSVQELFKAFGAVLRGDWSAVWNHLKNFMRLRLVAMVELVKAAAPRIAAAAQAIGRFLWQKIKQGADRLPGVAQAALSALWGKVKEYAPKVGAAALDLGKRLYSRASEEAAKLPGKIGDIAAKIPGALRGVLGAVGSAALEIGSRILSSIGSGLASLGSMLAGKVRDAVNSAIGSINSRLKIGSMTASLRTPQFSIPLPFGQSIDVPSVGRSFTVGPFDLPDIPMMAKGGIVKRPTVAMIGEAGPEAVVPLGRSGGVGGVTVVVNVSGSVVSERDLVESVRKGLQTYQRRNVSVGFA